MTERVLHGVAAAPGPVFEDFNLLRAAALAGQGVALCPLAIVREDIAAGRLVQLSETAIRGESAYYVLTRRGAAPGAAAAFRDWLVAMARAADGREV